MAKTKFDISIYGDNLIDYYKIRADKWINKVEAGIMKAVEDMVFEAYTIQKVNRYWTNQTWNLLSSLFAVVFYNGKVLGRETGGWKVEEPKRKTGSHKSKKRERNPIGAMGVKNPVFAYLYTGRGMAEWRGDDKEHYPYYGGVAYAQHSVKNIQKRYGLTMRTAGYTVVVGFGMPYAYYDSPQNSLGGTMKYRTRALTKKLIESLRKKLNKVDPSITLRVHEGDYKASVFN